MNWESLATRPILTAFIITLSCVIFLWSLWFYTARTFHFYHYEKAKYEQRDWYGNVTLIPDLRVVDNGGKRLAIDANPYFLSIRFFSDSNF